MSPDLLALAFPAGGAQTALHVDLSGSDGSLTGALRQVLQLVAHWHLWGCKKKAPQLG